VTLPPLTLNAWLRYGLIKRLLALLDDGREVLEIGAGEGAMGTRLARRFTYVGVEPDERSFQKARVRVEHARGTALQGDLSILGTSVFDLVCAFEVLEHLNDDRAALHEWRERIRPGGWLVLSVPANAGRFGPWDRSVGHYRRYQRKDLANALAETGYTDPVIWTYGFPLGYLLEWGRNRVARRTEMRGTLSERTAASGRILQPPGWMGWLTWITTVPFRIVQRPFSRTVLGTGLVARARRPR
jgi:SAM-dependent methyltransferase